MSVTISFKWLLAPKFADTIRKVSNFQGFPSIKDSYNASRIVEQLESELKLAQGQYTKIAAKYAPILGNQKGGENNGNSEESKQKEEAQENYKKEIVELLELTCTLEKRDPIKIEQLEGLALSPAEILCINQVLDFSAMDTSEAAAKALISEALKPESPQP